MAWGLCIEDFYNYPSHQIIRVWQGVQKAKARDTNAISLSTASLAHMVYEYIRDHEKSSSRSLDDFLPYDLRSAERSKLIDEETATIIIAARDEGNLPPSILADIIKIPDLYQAILQMAVQTGGESSRFRSL
jgi:hypothetical protein